jgi:hypothetical protein
LPEKQSTTDVWRREAERATLKGLFLVRVESDSEAGDPRDIGFDYSIGFQPNWWLALESRILPRKWWHLRTAEPIFYDEVIPTTNNWSGAHRRKGPDDSADTLRLPELGQQCAAEEWCARPRELHAEVLRAMAARARIAADENSDVSPRVVGFHQRLERMGRG